MNRNTGRWWLWAALLVAGQVATLALIHAGNLVGYQHYIDVRQLIDTAPRWALLLFIFELLAVGTAAWQHRHFIATTLRATGWWRLGLVVVGMVITSATLSRNMVQYIGELGFASLVQLVHLGAVACFADSLGATALTAFEQRLQRLLGPSGNGPEPGGLDPFAWTLAATVAAVAAVLALVAYQRHPHIPDEVVYLLQAQYLAAGRLTLPLPAVPEAFSVDLMLYQADRWFSSAPPGWPFILAIGAFLRVPSLVNPLLGGLNILLTYLFLRELYSRRTARLAVILLAASPWALFMAMNFMTHTATLSATLVAAIAVARIQREPRLRLAVVAGIGIGVVGLVRPLDGLTVAMLLGLWSLAARGQRLRFAPAAVMTLVATLTGALVLPYNWYLMGSARTFPVMTYFDRAYGVGTNALGFGANRGVGWEGLDPIRGHGAVDVAINANFNLFQVNVELLGWATGSMLVLLMLAFGRWRRADRLLLGVVAVIVAMQSLYWFSGGPDFGARYWFLVIVPCVALAARSLEELEARARMADAVFGAPRLLAGAGALLAVALLVFVPWRAVDKYYHYRGMRPDIRSLASGPEFRHALVLIRGRRHPDYSSAVVYGGLARESSDPVFVWDRGDSVRAALVAKYRARRFWIIDGPSVTRDGFRVVAGPLTGAELLARHDTPLPD